MAGKTTLVFIIDNGALVFVRQLLSMMENNASGALGRRLSPDMDNADISHAAAGLL